jgi:UDP-N-acetylmuramate--alanine ligase
LKLSPTIAVVTNVDEDHLDYYSGLDEICAVFIDFINKIPFYGLAVLCLDNANIQALLPQVDKRYVTYGLTPQADYRATDITYSDGGSDFNVTFKQHDLGRMRLEMPGEHNVLNALAALAVARELDLSADTIRAGFAGFAGVQRRFQIKYDNEVMVVDDYGHHPAEIKATLAAARNGWDKRIVAVFQPHRYSRTQALFNDFVTTFYQADYLIVMDIYAAGEDALEGIDAEMLTTAIAQHGHRDVHYCATAQQVVELLQHEVRPGDLVLTLGAGSVWQVGEQYIATLGHG